MTQHRLSKIIADSGLCSRRDAEVWITAGQVKVNGKIVKTLPAFADPKSDTILVDGKPLPRPRPTTILLNKPAGVVTTRSDERGRSTVYQYIPEHLHSVDPAGRLDKDTSGALILTNDGDLLYQLTHPKFHLPKVYRVTLKQKFKHDDLHTLIKGVKIMSDDPDKHPDGLVAKAHAVSVVSPYIIEITLITGHNRQIRKSLGVLGYQIEKLKRTAIGPLHLGYLKPGAWRFLKPADIITLQILANPKAGTNRAQRSSGAKLPAAKKDYRSATAKLSKTNTRRPKPNTAKPPQTKVSTKPVSKPAVKAAVKPLATPPTHREKQGQNKPTSRPVTPKSALNKGHQAKHPKPPSSTNKQRPRSR
jgi:pseudouridine synthase